MNISRRQQIPRARSLDKAVAEDRGEEVVAMSAIAGCAATVDPGWEWTPSAVCPRCASRWNRSLRSRRSVLVAGPGADVMNTYPDWNKDATNSREDWRNLGSVFPGDKL